MQRAQSHEDPWPRASMIKEEKNYASLSVPWAPGLLCRKGNARTSDRTSQSIAGMFRLCAGGKICPQSACSTHLWWRRVNVCEMFQLPLK